MHKVLIIAVPRQDSALSTLSLNSSVMSETSLVEGSSPYRWDEIDDNIIQSYLQEICWKAPENKGNQEDPLISAQINTWTTSQSKSCLRKTIPIFFRFQESIEHWSRSPSISGGKVFFTPKLIRGWQGISGMWLLESTVPGKCIEWVFLFIYVYFKAMNLPSFRAVYLFLCRVPKDIILECLKIRLEQKPLEPSELSIRQLMRECKDALK